MKFNLKEIKDAYEQFYATGNQTDKHNLGKQIEGFEAELREKMKFLNVEIHELMKEKSVGMQKVRANKIGRYSEIKEILGE